MNRELLEKRAGAVKAAREILNKAESEKREPTAEERSMFDAHLAEARRISDDDSLRTLEDFEGHLQTSRGRQTRLVRADNAYDNGDRTQHAPGELRFLKPSEKISEVHPCHDGRESRLNLGTLVALAAGESPRNCENERRALSQGMDASGGFAVPVGLSSQIFDMARNRGRVFQAGAQTYMMQHSKEALPKLASGPVGSWKAENNEVAADTATSLAAVELQSRTLMFWIPISRELWSDASNLGPFLVRTMAEAAAVELDRVSLFGSGEGIEPRGLYYDSDVVKTGTKTVDLYDDLSDSIYRIEAENHTPGAIIVSPRTQNVIRKLQDGEGKYITQPVWCPPIFSTKQVPDTLGTGTDSAVITGDFSNLLVGIRENFQLEILKEVASQNFQIVLMGALRADVVALRPKAFDVVTEVTDEWYTA